jgi:hypothetical protein
LLGLSATSQQYFSPTTNQPPATSQQYSSLKTNQHQPSATSQPNRLLVAKVASQKRPINCLVDHMHVDACIRPGQIDKHTSQNRQQHYYA